MMKKIYMQPNMRAIEIDMQNLIADSFQTFDEKVDIDGEGNISTLSRDNSNLWDDEW